jgi:hypothetical protein
MTFSILSSSIHVLLLPMSSPLELTGSRYHELTLVPATTSSLDPSTTSSPRSLPAPIPVGFGDIKHPGEDDDMVTWFPPWLPPSYWGFAPLQEDCVACDADSILHIFSSHHPFCITNWVECWSRLPHAIVFVMTYFGFCMPLWEIALDYQQHYTLYRPGRQI